MNILSKVSNKRLNGELSSFSLLTKLSLTFIQQIFFLFLPFAQKANTISSCVTNKNQQSMQHCFGVNRNFMCCPADNDLMIRSHSPFFRLGEKILDRKNSRKKVESYFKALQVVNLKSIATWFNKYFIKTTTFYCLRAVLLRGGTRNKYALPFSPEKKGKLVECCGANTNITFPTLAFERVRGCLPFELSQSTLLNIAQ